MLPTHIKYFINEIKETVRHSVCILFCWRYNSQTTYNEKEDVLFASVEVSRWRNTEYPKRKRHSTRRLFR